jgi:hypothetical protein
VKAFYLITARFWELGLGVLLQLAQPWWQDRLGGLSARQRNALAVPAIALMVGSIVGTNAATFPWPGAIAPVLATGLLIMLVVAGQRAVQATNTADATASGQTRDAGWIALLSWRPWVALGKRSYSLYLWHWPVFVLARWTTGLDDWPDILVAISIVALLTAASYRWVEQPLRQSARLRSWPRGRLVGAGVGALFCSALLALALFAAQPWLTLSVTRDSGIWDAAQARALPGAAPATCMVDRKKQPFSDGDLIVFEPRAGSDTSTACRPSGRRILVAGDSHAGAYAGLMRLHAGATGDMVWLHTKAGCSVFGLMSPQFGSQAQRPQCQAFIRAFLDEVEREAHNGDIVFLPSLRITRLRQAWEHADETPPASSSERLAAVAEAHQLLGPLAARGVRIVFEAPKPVFGMPTLMCSDWFNRHNPACEPGPTSARRAIDLQRRPVIDAMSAIISHLPGASIWDPLPVLCPGVDCNAYHQGQPLFVDGDHLSGYGNAFLVDDFSRSMQR